MSHVMTEPMNEHFDDMNELENANTNSGWVQFRVAILTAKFLVSGHFVKPLAVKNALFRKLINGSLLLVYIIF